MTVFALLAVGDELVSGERRDSNSPWLARALRARGAQVASLQIVGDDIGAVRAVVERGLQAADALIVTGGLGPTRDDLTREGVAAALGLPVEPRAELLAELRARAAARGRPLEPDAERQGWLPAGAEVLDNPRGTAPGFVATRADGRWVACLPGVPTEMEGMAQALLAARVPRRPALASRRLLLAGLTEAALGERLADLMHHAQGERLDARLGITAQQGVLTVTLRGASGEALDAMEAQVRARCPEELFGAEDDTLASVVVARLAAAGQTVTTAESCTGGLLAGAITSVPGASAVFREGLVTYADEAKRTRLDVPAALLAAHGAVSEPVALAMAQGARRRAGADHALAVSGIAGPDGGSADKPVGTIVIAHAADGAARAFTHRWKGRRDELRARSVAVALDLRRRALPALLLVLAAGCGAEPPARPNVLVWLVDTLRADHLGCYGYARPTSPHIDALAAQGVLFTDAHVHSNWTQPSVASLLSGRNVLPWSEDFTSTVPSGLLLLPQWLAQHGWATAGFTSTVATAARYGFAQGYETYEELDLLLVGRQRTRRSAEVYDAEQLVDAAVRWMGEKEARGDARPFFLYLHSVDPHAPYGGRDGPDVEPDIGSVEFIAAAQRTGHVWTESERRRIVELYDEDIARNDAAFGRLLEELDRRGLARDTLVVVVSDHGEEFWEHAEPGPGHGHRSMHRELTHVPLVLRWPAGLPAGARVEGLMRGIDLAPTLVELLGLPPLPEAEGRSVAGAARAGRALQRDESAGTLVLDRAKPKDPAFLAVRTSEWLWQFDAQAGEDTLHDLRADPTETGPAVHDPAVAARFAALVEAWLAQREAASAALGRRPAAELDERTREQLQALGYVGEGPR